MTPRDRVHTRSSDLQSPLAHAGPGDDDDDETPIGDPDDDEGGDDEDDDEEEEDTLWARLACLSACSACAGAGRVESPF